MKQLNPKKIEKSETPFIDYISISILLIIVALSYFQIIPSKSLQTKWYCDKNPEKCVCEIEKNPEELCIEVSGVDPIYTKEKCKDLDGIWVHHNFGC